MQQPPYPPPSQKPLPHQRFWRWFRQRSKRTQIIVCVVLILSCSLCGYISTTSANTSVVPTAATPTATQDIAVISIKIAATATQDAQNQQATATAAPTDTSTPALQPTVKPTAKPTKAANMTITHGTPHLGGPISDFYGKYSSHIFGTVQSGSAPNGSPEESVGWVTDSNNAYFLSVHYYTPSNVVNYIDYVGSSDWSKAQYRDYLLLFAPPGTTEDTQAN
jgi:hypothetical protein